MSLDYGYLGLAFDWRYQSFIVGLVASLVLVYLFGSVTGRLRCRLRRLGSRTWVSIAMVFCLSIAINLMLGSIRSPYPKVHDEWAYLLSADTYASGRLTNPPHPHWRHFETFHVLLQPTYISKYPPAQGISMAVGQVLFGHPAFGVWITLAAAVASIYWMLRAWLPPQWALIGGVLVAINTSLLLAWGQTYWGGGVALLGGALLFGALRRFGDLNRDRLHRDWLLGLVFGVGAVLLALSRPLEGLIACLAAGAGLIGVLLGNRPRPVASLLRFSTAAGLIGLLGISFILVNNKTVTGNAARLPYTEYSKQHGVGSSMFIWGRVGAPRDDYRLGRMKSYADWSFKRREQGQSWQGYWHIVSRKLVLLWRFFPFLGGFCLLPLPFLLWRKDPWLWFAVTLVLFLVILELQFANSWAFPHYFAPIACLFYVLQISGLRSWQLLSKRNRLFSIVVPTVTIYSIACLVTISFLLCKPVTRSKRIQIEQRLWADSNKHLVFVDYSNFSNVHAEFVYNRADIDNAKIVWAHKLTLKENEELISYYGDTRRVWFWDVGNSELNRHSAAHSK